MASDIMLRPVYWASVSGGKDSLFMLKLILSRPDLYPLDGVAHFELEIDYPFIKDVIAYMRSECEKVGIPFVSIKPSTSYWDLYEKHHGMPARNRRWCNNQYKLEAKKQLKDFLNSRGEKLVSYIGFCADEVRRFKVELGERDGVSAIYPLAEQGIQEATILEWAKTVPLFNDFYKYNDRCGCMYCPFCTMKECAYLYRFYPEHYQKLMKMATETEAGISEIKGAPYSIWNGNPKYNTAYREKRVKEVYLPKLLEQINAEK